MKKISAKQLREMLLELSVYNDHELFKIVNPTPPVISHVTSNKWQSPRWRVWRVGRNVDPNAHWKDNGAKAFLILRVRDETPGQAKNRAFNAAVAWASEKYTRWSDEWVKTPFGSWVPKDALEIALSYHLPEHFGRTVYVPPTELPDMRPLSEAVKKAPLEPTGDSVVKRITDKLYAEDPEWAESEPAVETQARPVGDMSESIRKAFDLLEGESRVDESMKVDVSTVETDGWYRVVGSGVGVFTYATSAEDAKKRVMFMINRISMDASLELHVTKRDPEVN